MPRLSFAQIRGLLVLAAVVAAYFFQNQGGEFPVGNTTPVASEMSRSERRANDDAIVRAFEAQRSDVLVEGEGTVEKVLRDDNKGSRHQRFLLALDSGHTLLFAHNIDLAPRVPDLRRGDRIRFKGEYEWNERGGVVHWTHHDPKRRHPGGWLQRGDQVYE